MTATYPQLTASLFEVKYFDTLEVNGTLFDVSIIELDKALIEAKEAHKKNRFAVMVDGMLSDADIDNCQFAYDTNRGTYTRMGGTMAFCKDIVKDIEKNCATFERNSTKAEKSRANGNNLYIRHDKHVNFVKNYFATKWQLKI